jgi:hypothetical protein
MPNKYGATRVVVDGLTFDSKRECARYGVLLLKQKAGLISGLQHHPPAYPLEVNGHLICKYIADFVYFDNQTQRSIVEDAKGVRTPEYRIKRKMMKAQYGIEIQEV